MADVWADWSSTAANNTPVGADTPDDLHVQLQNIKAQVKGNCAADTTIKAGIQDGSYIYAADAGSTDAYAITLSPAITAYANGQMFLWKANTANTGACTLAVNGLAATNIKKQVDGALVALATGDIIANQKCIGLYDADNSAVVLINPSIVSLAANQAPYALLQNRQTQNTSGGTATSGSWQIIPLNVEAEDTGSIVDSTSLPAFTLAAGTYRLEGVCPFFAVNSFITRVYQVTATAGVVSCVGGQDFYGSAGQAMTPEDVIAMSFLNGTFTLTDSKQLRVEYYVSNTMATFGLGVATNLGPEVYAQIKITKIA